MLTEKIDKPCDLPKQCLISRDAHPLRVHVLPEQTRFDLFVLLVDDSVVLVVLLDPITSPQRIDDMLRLGR